MLDCFGGEAQERVGVHGKQGQRRNFFGTSRDVGTLRATKVFDWAEGCMTHSFVKTDINSSLDAAGFEFKPDHALRGVRGITKKNASSGMEGELGRAFARGTDPDAATKGSEIGEIVLVFGTW